MDAYSTKIFLKDIMEIYLHYVKGTAYPKPMRPYVPALLKELAYMKSEQYEADKKYWYDLIQLLPSGYNQMRTVTLNYENLINIYYARRNHKLDEWHTLCDWIKTLPYAEKLILVKED